MSDATEALFTAVRGALMADGAISALVGARVRSDWGGDLAAPYIRLDVPRVRPWEDDCGVGSESDLRVHVFTTSVMEATRIAGMVRAALHGAALDIDGHDLRNITFERTEYLGDAANPALRRAISFFTVVTTET